MAAVKKKMDLVSLEDTTSQKKSRVSMDQALFEPSVKVVEFSEYEPFTSIEKVIKFRNNDYVARRIRLEQPSSPYFEVRQSRAKQSKVATGMELGFVVKFTPSEVREYRTELVCWTEREKFIIPVIARGMLGSLGLPSGIFDLGVAAVKSTKTKPLLALSKGGIPASFSLSTDMPDIFEADPSHGYVESGQMASIEIRFIPRQVQVYSACLKVQYEDGRTDQLQLVGKALEADVQLSTTALKLEPTYVTLASRATLTIQNNSDIPVDFTWAHFQSALDQEEERRRLAADLDQMYELEESHILLDTKDIHTEAEQNNIISYHNDSDSDLSGDEGAVPSATRRARRALETKYRHLRNALKKDDMLFVDDHFEVSPISGRIAPLQDIQITVSFCPDTAAIYNCVAFLDVVGREQRVPLFLNGVGIGPKASLSYDVLDQGDVFIKSPYQYALRLTNQGDIPATWRLSSEFEDSSFRFEPHFGTLEAPAGETEIQIAFQSTTLGEFCEKAFVELQGSDIRLECLFRGCVIGPTFHFDVKSIDFGLSSYAFDHHRSLTLYNTSDIAMHYKLRIPEDDQQRPEFKIYPEFGSLDPGASIDITVTFTPFSVRVFEEYSLVVDVEDIGDALTALPITAECAVPEVTIVDSTKKSDTYAELDFDTCYLRYPYKRELVLVNDHPVLSAKFEIVPQEPATTAIAKYSCDTDQGIIPPSTTIKVHITLKCNKLGSLRLPLTTAIVGSTLPPLQTTLLANGKGPDLTLSLTELSWGPIRCLMDETKCISVTNQACIPAPLKIFVKSNRSKFRVDIKEAVVAPNATLDLKVIACLDDNIVHKDQLHVVVAEGENLMVPLTAKGIGTTIDCFEDLTTLDFGPQLSANSFERKITLENKGRRSQTIRWTNESDQQEPQVTTSRKKKNATDNAKHIEANEKSSSLTIFSVEPNEIELRPRTAAVFTIQGLASAQGLVEERLVCDTRLYKEKNWRTVYNTLAKADIIVPLLDISDTSLVFIYNHEPENHMNIKTQIKTLTMRNTTVLPLSFSLRCSTPFAVDTYEHSLEPGMTTTVQVSFDPGYKGDCQSQRLDARLSIVYEKHPQRDSIQLIGEINFPNLSFEYTTVNFGCVLNDTTMNTRMRVTNCSKVNCNFNWAFLESDNDAQSVRSIKSRGDSASSPGKRPYVSVNQVFDILPIRSTLAPGEIEDVEFVYYGHAGRKFKGSCLCEVEGGPEYTITLLGEASTVGFKLDKERLDFGKVIYTKTEVLELTILNTGKVAFPFSIFAPKRDGIEVYPSHGKVSANDKQSIQIRMKPLFPVAIKETLRLDIAHFQPMNIPITAVGIFSFVSVSLPRDEPRTAVPSRLGGTWSKLLAKCLQGLKQQQQESCQLEEGQDLLPKSLLKAQRAPTQKQVEIEAMRTFFLDYLQATTSQESMDSNVGPSRDKPSEKLESLNKTSKSAISKNSFVLAWYQCDFGNVVSGTSRKRTFTVTNSSSTGPLSWVFEKKLLANTGFSIDHEKVVKLPEGSSVKYVVTLNAKKNYRLGKRELVLPIELSGKSGPSAMIVLTANITTPDLELSVDTLDFGSVWTGCCKTMYFKLLNPSPVVTEWQVTKPLSPSRDEARFTLDSRTGTLLPGKSALIAVEFVPTDERVSSFKLPIKVSGLSKNWYLSLTGVGVVAKILFEPSVIDMGPILPFQSAVMETVHIKNMSDRRVELYSLDFDEEYKQDEITISDHFDEEDLIRFPVFEPGQSVSMICAKKSFTSEGQGEESIDEGLIDDSIAFGGPSHDVSSLRARGLVHDLALVVPPLGDGPALTAHLAEQFAYAVATPQGALAAVAQVQSSLGRRARRHLGLQTDSEAAQEAIAACDAMYADAAVAAAVAQLATTAAKERKPSKKGKKGAKASELPMESVVEAAPLVSSKEKCDHLTVLYADAMKWRASRKDADHGIIIDLSDPQDTAPKLDRSVSAVLLGLSKADIVIVDFESKTYSRRLEALHSQATLTVDILSEVTSKEVKENRRPSSSCEPLDAATRAAFDSEKERPATRSVLPPDEAEVSEKLAAVAKARMIQDRTIEYLRDPENFKKQYLEKAFALNLDNSTERIKCIEVKLDVTEDVESFDLDSTKPLEVLLANIQEPFEPRPVRSTKLVDIPPPTTQQLVAKPRLRLPRPPHRGFVLAEASEDAEEKVKYRWILEAEEEVAFNLSFAADSVGRFKTNLGFEVVGLPNREFGLTCSGLCALPTINVDPRNVFMHRVKNRPQNQPVFKRYILSEGVFDFGPLLTWKQPEMRDDESRRALFERTNCEDFRISNNSSFTDSPLIVHFELADDSDTTFFIEPRSMELAAGETRNLQVWAFPQSSGDRSNTLLALVAQNPEPYAFKISCAGVEPTVSLSGPWKTTDPVIDFDRLLLGRSEVREIVLQNEALCPVDWRLDLSTLEDISELTISPSFGTIPNHGTATIEVSFKALGPNLLEPILGIEYSDAEGGLESKDRIKRLNVSVRAEAYRISCIVLDDDPNCKARPSGVSSKVDTKVEEKTQPGTLQFGQIRVGDTKQLGFLLRNKGKYDFAYDFGFKKATYSDVLHITPKNGLIKAGDTIRIVVTCCALTEIKLQDNKDITCTISEPATGEAVEFFSVTVAVQTLFPLFRVQPLRGLFFGTTKYNDGPKERRLEIRNEGRFAVPFAIFNANDTSDAQAESKRLKILAATPKALITSEKDINLAVEAKLLPPPLSSTDCDEEQLIARTALLAQLPDVGKTDPPSSETLTIEHFAISPSGGIVQPGQTFPVTVTFNPEGCAAHKAAIELCVAGADPADPNGKTLTHYELVAESRSPGIETNDWYQIFEEQAIIARLSDAADAQTLPLDGDKNGENFEYNQSSELPARGGVFAIEEQLFSFGTTVLTEGVHTSAERFKITNPNKVPAIVDFAVDGVDSNAFTVHPSSWEVPSFEHRFVTVYFHPSEMREYRAKFGATVQDHIDPIAGSLTFGLAGLGALPSVTISGSALQRGVIDGDERKSLLTLELGRIQVGRMRKRTLGIYNDGVLPATALVSLTSRSNAWKCVHAGTSIRLEPGEKQDIEISFFVSAIDDIVETKAANNDVEQSYHASLTFRVLDNRYETTIVNLSATAFESDVIVEGLKEDPIKGDELSFGDINLFKESSSKLDFTVHNTRKSTVRVEWPDDNASVCFRPRLAHLLPGQKRSFVINLNAGNQPRRLDDTITFHTKQIQLEASESDHDYAWYSDCVLVPVGTENENNTDLSAPSTKSETPEPTFSTLSKTLSQSIRCTAIVDRPAFVSSTTQVTFRPTPLFQSQNYSFEVTNKSMIALDYNWFSLDTKETNLPAPFSIEPAAGALRPQKSTKFNIRFMPQEVDNYKYKLECRMPALLGFESGVSVPDPIVLQCCGPALRPVCHFDLVEDSDYLAKRDTKMLNEYGQRGQIEASSVRVVKVISRGLRVQNTKRFLVCNPTASAWDFTWEVTGRPHAAWRCTTPSGTILSGKRGEMIFEFTPNQVGVAENFFRFKIRGHDVEELFLFVGSVLEPRVALDRTCLNFSAVMTGSLATETIHIVNQEHVPFSFHFDNPEVDQHIQSTANKTQHRTLEVVPSSGLVPPNGSSAIEVLFRPKEEGFLNANLNCTVRKKQMRLGLNIKGECYAVKAKVHLVDVSNGPDQIVKTDDVVLNESSDELTAAPIVNMVNFGTVHVNHTTTKTLVIQNTGKFNLDYALDTSDHANAMLAVSQIEPNGTSSGFASTNGFSGTIRKDDRAGLLLSFHPVSPTKINGTKLVLTLAGKVKYYLRVTAEAVAPAMKFSFLTHDFGPCFISIPGQSLVRETATLRITNNDAAAKLSLDCGLPRNNILQIDCSPSVLKPGETIDVPCHFTPRDAKDYMFPVPFLVDGATTVSVAFRGCGVAARLELAQSSYANVVFGDVKEEDEIIKKIVVVNRSNRAMDFELKPRDDVEEISDGDLTIEPSIVQFLKPKKSATIEIRFAPRRRRPRGFEVPILASYAGSTTPLFTISGRATGMEVSLSTDTLSFGAVCIGSRRSRVLRLENTGDITTRFHWNQETLRPELFSVQPLEGSIRAGSELSIEVTFMPENVDEDVRLDGMQLIVDNAPMQLLTCIGSCVSQPDDTKQTLEFESSARKPESKTVTVSNPSGKAWYLAPTLRHAETLEHFRCANEFVVPAGSKSEIEVTYLPLTCETEHNADLFLALPDGTALLYALHGKAGPPKAIVLSNDYTTPAKQSLHIKVPVSNWLTTAQQFEVELSVRGGESTSRLEGPSTHDLVGNETKEYSLRLFAYKPGSLTVVAIFRNSGEYASYDIPVEVTAADVTATIELEAPVRQTARRLLTVDNPLPEESELTFAEGDSWWRCDSPYVRLNRISAVRAQAEIVFEVEYRPLLCVEDMAEAMLHFNIVELGEYVYKLHLRSTAPSSQPHIRFDVSLGMSSEQPLPITVYSPKADAITFAAHIERNDAIFRVERSIKVTGLQQAGWEGKEVLIPIRYEPDALGDMNDTLVLDGGEAGIYKCALLASCRRPAPRGPVSIQAGGSKHELKFRNVFSSPTEFKFALDSSLFQISTKAVTIPPRATQTFSITYTGGASSSNAKLLVTCGEGDSEFCWTYYLRGVPAASNSTARTSAGKK